MDIKENQIIIANAIYENIPKEKIDAIYNAGFLDLSHKKTKNQNNTLIDRVSLLSENQIFDISEWELSGMQYHEENTTACICGKTNIKKRYVLENLKTHSRISIGSSCLEKHFHFVLDKETLNAMEYAKGSGGKYSWLGAKYDALIFSVLGFKKSMLYFEDRKNKKKVHKDIDKLLRVALHTSLRGFQSTYWHERLQRGRRLYEKLIDNIVKAKKQFYIEQDFKEKRLREKRTKQSKLASKRSSEKFYKKTDPIYKKTEIQETELLNILGLKNTNLSSSDVWTLNTMKSYYTTHIKYREQELTQNYSILHKGRNLLLTSYKQEFYALALVGTMYYIYQVVSDNVLIYYGKVSTENEVGNMIDQFYIEQETVF